MSDLDEIQVNRFGGNLSAFLAKNNFIIGILDADVIEDRWHICRVNVKEGHRGKGIGKRLMQKSLEIMKASLIKEVFVFPGGYDYDSEKQIKFYTDNGFVEGNERGEYIKKLSMTKEELRKFVEHEAQWLKYYSLSDYKKNLHFNDHLFYDRLKSIGYTKRIVALDRRCMGAAVTAKENVTSVKDVSDLFTMTEPRDHEKNCYSPLEAWIILYPNDVQWILDYIQG